MLKLEFFLYLWYKAKGRHIMLATVSCVVLLDDGDQIWLQNQVVKVPFDEMTSLRPSACLERNSIAFILK